MSTNTRTVLITGCSDGSLGAALAYAFHEQGLKVFATARNTDKMNDLKAQGITCLELDAQSQASIDTCVQEVSGLTAGTLDVLINSTGGGYYMPFLHIDLSKARELFEVNVWSYVAVTQAFMPLLLKGKSPASSGKQSLLVNNTSISSVLRTPYHSVYGASKAAMAAFNDAQRIELQPLGIRVIDLKTGSTESNFSSNRINEIDIPEDSPYQLIKDEVIEVISGNKTEAYAEDQEQWAKNVVQDLLQPNPPAQIWRGGAAGRIQLTSKTDGLIPESVGDSGFRKLGGLDKLEKILSEKTPE